MKTTIQILMLGIMIFFVSCKNEEPLTYSKGDVKISVVAGENWIHKFPMFLGIDWIIRRNLLFGSKISWQYLSTIYVTEKIATQGWVSSGGNRRKEALPHWCHQRGVIYVDVCIYQPRTTNTDAQTGATPKSIKN
jgi:hypothetical protein